LSSTCLPIYLHPNYYHNPDPNPNFSTNLNFVQDEWSLLGAIGIHLTLTLNPNSNPTPNPDPTPSPKP